MGAMETGLELLNVALSALGYAFAAAPIVALLWTIATLSSNAEYNRIAKARVAAAEARIAEARAAQGSDAEQAGL